MKRSFLIIITLAFTISLSAQRINFRHGSRLYNKLAYSQAIPYLKDAYKVDTTNTEALRMLADSYRLTNDVDNTLEYYAKLVQTSDAKPIEKYYYGQALMKKGEYKEAQKWLTQYNGDDRGKNQAQALSNMSNFYKDSTLYKVTNLSEINSASSEIGVALFQDKLLFSSNRYRLDNFNNKHKWTGKDFYKVFSKDLKNDNISVVKFSRKMHTKYNVGPIAYNAAEKKMYLTRNHVVKGRSVKASDKQIKLQIYTSEYNEEKGKWSKAQAFAYNDKDYNVGHPSFNASGDIMVFASDMPGGEGGMDLWVSFKKNDEWTKPKNLGKSINTKGNEVFPNISSNDLLFYSSDGKAGLGGLDIYYCNFKNGEAKSHKTLGYPINTCADDFGFVLTEELNKAYFVSNRKDGKGSDDVYILESAKPFRSSIIIAGNAYDAETGATLTNTNVELLDKNNKAIGTVVTTENGYYEFEIENPDEYPNLRLTGEKEKYNGDDKSFKVEVPEGQDRLIVDLNLEEVKTFGLYCLVTDRATNEPLENVHIRICDAKSGNRLFTFNTSADGDFRTMLEDAKLNDKLDYKVEIEKEGYLAKSVMFNKVLDKPGEVALHEYLDFRLDKIEVGTDIGKIIEINPIYFDLDKSNIRPDAAVELDKIVKVMQENPNMVIELGSHTDCRASKAYNMRLSDRRAKASAAYIVSQGIEKKRIYGKGYGESKLVNHCECEGNKVVPCTEEEHQMNRRTEFVIVKM